MWQMSLYQRMYISEQVQRITQEQKISPSQAVSLYGNIAVAFAETGAEDDL